MLEFMKNKILIPSFILLVLGIFFSFRYGGNKAKPATIEEQTVIMQTLMDLLSEGHYSPRPIDDSFSASVFERTFEGFDYDKRFFLKEDYERLKAKYKNNIDDQIKSTSLEFFNEINDLFVQRIAEAEKLYPELLKRPYNFELKDSILLDGKKVDYVNNSKELKERWNQSLKYRVLIKYADLKKTEDKKVKDSVGYKAKSFATLEKEARESILKVQDRYFKRLNKLNDNDRFAMYMNNITTAEDPHTNYMPPKDKKRFEEMMSGSFIGIGASLQQMDDGKIKVSSIITGSPSWKQGKLKEEDVINSVAQGEATPVDVEGMDLEDVVEMIRGKKGTEVRLTVTHASGTTEVIPIIRGDVELEDVFAKSAILQENGKRIGYIYLPEFYSNFNGITGRRSAVDVKKEVEKLKAENVDGIVLDLRNNGGGSLSDVVDMVGLFVGNGPVVQVRSSGGNSVTLRSKTPLVYSGPLAVMINAGSASASEILAAALQDYGRAVIVGSNSFGKGTVQKIVPLDQFVPFSMREKILQALNKAKGGEVEYDGIGFVKLTIQKFYRIDGGSTQLRGVLPDVPLPDTYEDMDYGERKDKAALPWDKIAAVPYDYWRMGPDLATLKKASKERVKENKSFQLVLKTNARLKKQKDNNVMPLKLEDYWAYVKESEDLSKQIDEIDSLSTPLVVMNLKSDLSRIELDDASKKKNEEWLKMLRKDAYIHETVNVVNDWILKGGRLSLDR